MATPRESSAAPSSAGDTVEDQGDDIKPRLADLEREDQSAAERSTPNPASTTKSLKRSRGPTSTGKRARPKHASHIWMNEGGLEGTEDEGSVASFSRGKKTEGTPDPKAKTIGTAVGTRRQANGTVGSVYSGSKVRHIKKEDGTPLWRKEIQYEFLRLVIENDQPVFTKLHTKEKGCTFSDIYVDCLARSSKTSKILRDRLQVDRQAANNMAMICLLVNVGRMNTTLNFFPEMRAQLRTYHSIPVLQAYKSQRDYKSLQDAPRLKSILKGASEDEEQPRTIEALQDTPVPRTNPVNVIFVISQFAPKVSEKHFNDKVDFFDLTMRSTISSASRARAFLWLMWWYLESNFTKDDALNNPFGAGEYKEGQDPEDPDTIPLVVPKLEYITEQEGDAENVDVEEEKEFAEKMAAERKRIMETNANEPPLTMADPEHKGIKRLKKSAASAVLGTDDDSIISDVDSRASPGVGIGRSPAPAADPSVILTMNSSLGVQADSLDDDFEVHDPHPGRGRYKRVRGKNTPSRSKGGPRSSDIGAPASSNRLLKSHRTTDTPEFRATPQPVQQPGTGHAVISQYGAHRGRNEIEAIQASRGGEPPKPRARTHYQRELEEHKMKRINWVLERRRKDVLRQARHIRQRSDFLLRAARRINQLPDVYDSHEEGDRLSFGIGGVLGRRHATAIDDDDEDPIAANEEEDDWGEEAESWARLMQRASRRVEVWSGGQSKTVSLRSMRAPTRSAAAIAVAAADADIDLDADADVDADGDGDGDMDPEIEIDLPSSESTPRKPLPTPVGGGNKGRDRNRLAVPEMPKSKREMDNEITADLLAEHDSEEGTEEGDNIGLEVDRQADVGDDEGEGVRTEEDEDGDTIMD